MKSKAWRINKDVDEDLIQEIRNAEDYKQEDSDYTEETHQGVDSMDFYSDDELERELEEDAISIEEEAFTRGYLHALEY